MKITIIVDNPNSWFVPHGKRIKNLLTEKGHDVSFTHSYKNIQKGDCLFLLSCSRIVGSEILKLNKHNIVIHASKLPKGQGFAPLIWQILKGKNKIYFTLFEAVEKVDSGDVYIQELLTFEGHELHDELRKKQAEKTSELILQFIDQYNNLHAQKQRGAFTWYRRRTPKDSELNINKSLKELFNQLRVADNKRYPAFFRWRNHTYILKIYKTSNKYPKRNK